MLKVMMIFGTRPEAIKMAPVVLELKKHPDYIQPIVTVTAQHREMLDQVLGVFNIVPNYDLNIMMDRQTLVDITTKVLTGLDIIMKKEKPDLVLVHGDTSTTFVGSLAAYYNQIPVGHVEAGLRTGNKYAPYPEEMNRKLTSVLADLHFAPTKQAAENLLIENKPEESIYITGNTVIDALKTTVHQHFHHEILRSIGDDRFILLTAHRRENLGKPMRNIFKAIKRVVAEQSDVQVVYPVHMNPVVRGLAKDIIGNESRVHLIEPLAVHDFHNIANLAKIILTDSGGIQEEAPSLGVPVLVLRDTTERPEGMKAGTVRLVGTREEKIYQMTRELLTDHKIYEKMAKATNPYGDGHAAKRITDAILYYYGFLKERPAPFEPNM